jgi:cell division protease FtsH
MALGVTQQLPIDDRHTYNAEYLLNNVAVLMGGRAAESLVLKHMTTGAGNDIERATEIARKMICEWGMSEKLGPLSFGKKEEQVFLGRDIGKSRDFSEETAIAIDAEMKQIVKDNYSKAYKLLEEHQDELHGLAEALLEKESLDRIEVDTIIFGHVQEDTAREAKEAAKSSKADKPEGPATKPTKKQDDKGGKGHGVSGRLGYAVD